MSLLRNSKVGLVAIAVLTSLSVAVLSASANAKVVSHKASAAATSVSVSSFTNNFTAMKSLKSIAKAGKGKIAEILPDTTSSTRYVEFDAPDFKKAAAAAGLPSSDVISQNGNDSDTTFIADAKADITNGAKVLLIDPEDSGTGVTVSDYAKAHHVSVIDYDRLIIGSNAPVEDYVSFNNVTVGKMIGNGFVTCEKTWLKGKKPNVIVMHGATTDNNATLFAQGYDSVIDPYFKSGKWTLAVRTAGTWNPTSPTPDALQEFEAALTAHSKANSAVFANDETGAPAITYLKSKGYKPFTFPMTGQDATLTGLQNILSGYQCGTVYKPVYKEAQAAVALALYMRAGKKAPSSLLNTKSTNPNTHKSVPSVLLTPTWVTTKNMKSTILKDNFVPKKALCASPYTKDCKKYGL